MGRMLNRSLVVVEQHSAMRERAVNVDTLLSQMPGTCREELRAVQQYH